MPVNDFSRAKIDATVNELKEERAWSPICCRSNDVAAFRKKRGFRAFTKRGYLHCAAAVILLASRAYGF